jgi:hypothetical protein
MERQAQLARNQSIPKSLRRSKVCTRFGCILDVVAKQVHQCKNFIVQMEILVNVDRKIIPMRNVVSLRQQLMIEHM